MIYTLLATEGHTSNLSGNGTGSDLNLDTNLNKSNGLTPPSAFNTSILDLPLNQEEISDPSLSIATVADIASLKLMITGMIFVEIPMFVY